MKTKDELQKELDGLIAKHGKGKVFTLETPLSQDDDCKFATLFLTAPNRTQLEMINSVLRKGGDSLDAVTVALKALYVGGDELSEVLNNEDALFGCDVPVAAIMYKRSGTIKKN